MRTRSFRDRRDAGRRLAALLESRPLVDPVVLALPRGGLPVGFEVACALDAPLEVFVARKVGAPGREEFGIGAIAEGDGNAVMSESAAMVGVGPAQFEVLVRREQVELARRRLAIDHAHAREARQPLLSEVFRPARDPERRQDCRVEGNARPIVACVQLDVIDDVSRPIPVLAVHARAV